MGAPKPPSPISVLEKVGIFPKGRKGDPSKNASPERDELTDERNALLGLIRGTSQKFVNKQDLDKFAERAKNLGDIGSLVKLREEFNALAGRGKDVRQRFEAITASIADRPGIGGLGSRGRGLLG